MSEEVKKEQTKAATQEEITELTEEQLEETAGGTNKPILQIPQTSVKMAQR